MDQSFELFIRKKPGIDFIHTGSVTAKDKDTALAKAKATLVQPKPGLIIWVVPTDEIITTDPDESDAFFEPAADKQYRHASFYDLPDGIAHM